MRKQVAGFKAFAPPDWRDARAEKRRRRARKSLLATCGRVFRVLPDAGVDSDSAGVIPPRNCLCFTVYDPSTFSDVYRKIELFQYEPRLLQLSKLIISLNALPAQFMTPCCLLDLIYFVFYVLLLAIG